MSGATFSVWADGTLDGRLTWGDFCSQVNLPPLPANLPRPPGGDVHVAGTCTETELALSCVLDFTADEETEFAGLLLAKEWRFEFRATVAMAAALSGVSRIAGDLFLETRAQLPELPDLPGVLELDTGDDSGWIGVRLHAEADENGELRMSAEVTKPLALRLQLPGMPQPEPPVLASLDRMALDFAAGPSGVTAKLELGGSFELHPFIPPIQLPVAQYLTPLFATLPDLRGSCRLTLGLENGYPALGFDATLDNAEVDIDIVTLLRDLASGLSTPQSSASEVPLEIDFGFHLIGLSFNLGAAGPGSSPISFAVTLKAGVTLGSVEAVGSILMSDQEFSFGLKRMIIPLGIPRFPITRAEFERWSEYDDPAVWESEIDAQIVALEHDTSRKAQRTRSRLQTQQLLMRAVCTVRGDYNDAGSYRIQGNSRDVYCQWLSLIFGALDEATSVVAGREEEARYRISALTLERLRDEAAPAELLHAMQGLMDCVYDSQRAFLSALDARLSFDLSTEYRTLILKCALIRGATLKTMIGDEQHHICDDLSIVLRDINFNIPFRSPRDIGFSGGAQFTGFVGPYTTLNDEELTLELSADLIYLTIKTIDGTIKLPTVGRYSGGSINFSEFRFGFGYTKRSLAIAFSGGVVLPRQLVDDLDNTATTTSGVGVRLPVQTRLSFRFELMPVPIVKVIPLFQFNLDLRQNYSPGLTDSRLCIPYWDGLQVIVPNVIHVALKHIAFSPIFAILPAMNWAFDGDVVLGDEHNGFSLIIDDLLGIDYIFIGTAFKIPIPGLAGDSPFCENFCMSLRVAGFTVSFNVQRPFPSFSPLALFELLALLSDPTKYKVNPHGELANSLRITLKDAYVVLPEAVRRCFPGSEDLLRHPLNITINLADYIGAAQQVMKIARPIVAAVIDAVGTDDARSIPAKLEQIKNQPDVLDWRKALTWLPAEVRTFSRYASFAGFSADAAVVLMTRDEALAELSRRGRPPRKPTPFVAFGPHPSFDREAFRSLCCGLPVPAGMPAIHDRNVPGNNAFAGPVFAGLTTSLLRQLLPEGDDMAVIAAARVVVLGVSQQMAGSLASNGAFRLLSIANIKPFVLRVAGLAIPVPLAFHGQMELAGDVRGGSVRVSVDASWDVLPGALKVRLGRPTRPVTLQATSDNRFALQGSAEIDLFGGAAGIKGSVDITESHCLVDGVFTYSLLNLVKVRASGQGRIGPQTRFDLAGNGTLTIFGKAFSVPSFKLDERGIDLETHLLLSKWKLPDGKTIPCAVDMKMRGGADFRDNAPNFTLSGEGDIEIFGASLSGRGGVRYQDGALSVFGEGALRWHDHEWLNARVELGPSRFYILGRVSLRFDDIKPPGFAVGMVAVLNLFARLELDPASGSLVNMAASGDWLLGVTLPGSEQILPIACGKLPALTELQLPYRLIKIDGFPVPKIIGLDLNIPLPMLLLDGYQDIRFPVSVTLPHFDTPSESENWWTGLGASPFMLNRSLVKEVHFKDKNNNRLPEMPMIELNFDLDDNGTPLKIRVPTSFKIGWEDGHPQFPLPFEFIPGFELSLIWNPGKKRFEISSDAQIQPPQIDVLYDPVGSDIAGEYVELNNTAVYPIDLSGWVLHDAADYTHTYTFPSFVLPPGEKVKVWTKAGGNDAKNLYWGLKQAVWNNLGDTVVLKNAKGTEASRYSYRPR